MLLHEHNFLRFMSLQIFRTLSIIVLVPAPDHVIRTPGVERTVYAPNYVCEPSLLQGIFT